jgi:hypothetical protein
MDAISSKFQIFLARLIAVECTAHFDCAVRHVPRFALMQRRRFTSCKEEQRKGNNAWRTKS